MPNDMLNYMKIEEFKRLLVTKLRSIGLQKYLDVATEDDLTKIMILTNELLQHMQNKEDKDTQIELLVTYIVGLWARLIIFHGDDVNEL